MNAKEYIDEVKLRLARLDVSLNLDNSAILTFVNRARREVQNSIIGLYPEHFGRVTILAATDFEEYLPNGYRVSISNSFVGSAQGQNRAIDIMSAPLDEDVLDVFACIVKYNTNNRYEARRVNKRELFGVQMQSWNLPTRQSPAYAIERDPQATTQSSVKMYFAGPSLDDMTALAPTIELWHTIAVPALEEFPDFAVDAEPDIERNIPYQFQELVVEQAMLDCLQRVDNTQAMESVRAEIEMLTELIKDTYTTARVKAESLLPSKQPLV